MSPNPHNILIVEDDQQVQILYQYILTPKYRLFHTATVVAAWEIIAIHTVDGVILDIGLVEEDGLQLVRQIRQEQKYAELPILAVTAHAFPADRQRALSAGCNAYLTKPFSQAQLTEIIEKLLKRETRNKHDRSDGK